MATISLISDRIRWDEKALINAASRIKVDLKMIDPKGIFIDVSGDLNEISDSFGDVAINRCITHKGRP